MILRSTDISAALRRRQRGFIIDPFRFAAPVTSVWDPTTTGGTGESLTNSNRTYGFNNQFNSAARGTQAYATNAGLDRYFEITVNTDSGASLQAMSIGIANSSTTASPGDDSNSYAYYGGLGFGTGETLFGGTFTSYGAKYAAGDVIGVRLNGTALTFYKNGVSQGLAFTLPSNGTLWYPAAGTRNSNSVSTLTLNTGYAAFVALPAGSTAWG